MARLNTVLQYAWIVIILGDLVLRHQFPRNFRYSNSFHLTGYLVAAVPHVVVLFRNFFHYRLFRLVDFSTARP